MTPLERTEKINKYFKKEYTFELMPSQLEYIVAQIEEAEREAVVKKEQLAYETGFMKGFAAARERAKEIFDPRPYPDCPVQMTYQEAYDRIAGMEPK